MRAVIQRSVDSYIDRRGSDLVKKKNDEILALVKRNHELERELERVRAQGRADTKA